jgi:hypothetical protein
MSQAPKSSPILFSGAALIAASLIVFVAAFGMWLEGDTVLAIAPLFVNGLVLLAWLAGALGFGLLALRFARIECALLLRCVIATALGLGILSLLTLGLGLFGYLNRATSIGLVALGVINSISFLRKPTASLWDSLKSPARANWFLLALIPLLSICTLCAILPPGILWGDEPNGYDVTEYHLQVPREWFEAGRIIALKHNVFSFFPFNVEMHYLLAMHLRGGPWAGMYLAQLMHLGFILLTVVAIYALASNKFGAITGALIAGATPWLGLLAPVAYNEGGLLLFGTLSVGLSLRALREDRPIRLLILAGAMAGFACGSKMTAVAAVLVPLPIVIAIIRRCVVGSLAFWLAGAVVFAPWLIRNAAWRGNPVFPEATSIFGKAHWSDTQAERWKRANHLPRADQQNLPARLHAGWDQVLGDPRFAFALIPLGIAAACVRRDRESIALIALVLVQAILWLFFTHLQSRFFVLSIPICAMLIAGVRFRGSDWIFGFIAIAFCIGGTCFVAGKLAAAQMRFADLRLDLFSLTGHPTLREFAGLPDTDTGKTIELVGGAQAFLYDVPMSLLYYRTVFDVDAQSGESAEQAWRKGWPPDGPDVSVIRDEADLERLRRTYWGIP